MYFQRLRDIREDKGLTQREIGELLHIRQNVYSRYELGVRTLPLEYLLVLADFYGTSTDYILGRTDDPNPTRKRNI